MNSYKGEERRRNQNLLIVEGNHEKNELFSLVFKCFPEMSIDIDDVWIYGTNIYKLYENIVMEYGVGWAEREDDIDLPYIISKKQHPEQLCYKEDFTNIIIVFDYERHDPNFSEEKILEMQRYFADAADMGQLYINYPMIESYQHLKSLPDRGYADRTIPVSLRPGKEYKALVKRETVIEKAVDFPRRIDDLLNKYLGICDKQTRDGCCDAILNISDGENIEIAVQGILQGIVEEARIHTIKYQLRDWIEKIGYLQNGQTYWNYMRTVFAQIIYHNICKANRIQNNVAQIEESQFKTCFYELDLTDILEIQNDVSRDQEIGFIWVLNTCVFLIGEYKFFWKQNSI